MVWSPLPQSNFYNLVDKKYLIADKWCRFAKAYELHFNKFFGSKKEFSTYLITKRNKHFCEYFRLNVKGKWEFNLGKWLNDEVIRQAQTKEVERLYYLASEAGFKDYQLAKLASKKSGKQVNNYLRCFKFFEFSDRLRPEMLAALKELEANNFILNKSNRLE